MVWPHVIQDHQPVPSLNDHGAHSCDFELGWTLTPKYRQEVGYKPQLTPNADWTGAQIEGDCPSIYILPRNQTEILSVVGQVY